MIRLGAEKNMSVDINKTWCYVHAPGIHNLFGLLERKQVVVHKAPLWFEWLFAVVIGFIAMELFYFLFRALNNRLILWRRCLRMMVRAKWKIKKARNQHGPF